MSHSLNQLVGQLIIAGFREPEVNYNLDIVRYIRDFNLGGIILYDEDLEIGGLGTRNIKSKDQIWKLTQQLQSYSDNGLLIAIDQEGGSVARLKPEYGFPKLRSWNHIGKMDDLLISEQFASSISDDLKACGINLNLAPVLDLNYGAETIIGKSKRALSSEPKKIAKHARIFINVLRNNNIISCGKHFPGQGSAYGDTHEGITDVSETWNDKDLVPYSELIQSGDLDMVMVAHVFNRSIDHKFPASLSKNVINNILRKNLGFTGLVICDDPSMKAISDNYDLEQAFELMLNAGVDLFCLGNNLRYNKNYISKSLSALSKLVETNKISEDRIYESINRVNVLRDKFNFNK